MNILPTVIFAIVLVVILGVFMFRIYRMFTTRQSTESKNRRMTILSILMGIFPIAPLGVVALVAGFFTLSELKIPIALFFFGGPVGLFALIRSLFGHTSKANFLMLIYGGLSYSALLLIGLIGLVSSGTALDVITGKLSLLEAFLPVVMFIYASLSATVFPWHLWITKKALNKQEVSI